LVAGATKEIADWRLVRVALSLKRKGAKKKLLVSGRAALARQRLKINSEIGERERRREDDAAWIRAQRFPARVVNQSHFLLILQCHGGGERGPGISGAVGRLALKEKDVLSGKRVESFDALLMDVWFENVAQSHLSKPSTFLTASMTVVSRCW
jgi:hypothetical protein